MNETKSKIVEILQAEADRRGEKFHFEQTTYVKNGDKKTALAAQVGDDTDVMLLPFSKNPDENDIMKEVDDIFLFLKESHARKEKYIQEILDWEKIKSQVIPTLVNTKLNENLLQYCPKEEIHDLSVIYSVILNEYTKVDVRYGLLKKWGITEEILKEQAEKNLLNNLVLELITEYPVLIVAVSNTWRKYGASAILTEPVKTALIKKMGENPYICPASKHDMIAFPRKTPSPEDIKNMVMDMNRNILSPEDFLSDSVYTIRDGKFVIEC